MLELLRKMRQRQITRYLEAPPTALQECQRREQLTQFLELRLKAMPAEHKLLDRKIARLTPAPGRAIDIDGLLAQRRPNLAWRWTIASPWQAAGLNNGSRNSHGQVEIRMPKTGTQYYTLKKLPFFRRDALFIPEGFVLLPQAARDICEQYKDKAEWIGVLYQPASWQVIGKDPAIVAKFPGSDSVRCLAVWGHDGPAIEEFVESGEQTLKISG